MKNFKPAFIDDSSKIRIFAVKDHAATDIHAYAMQLLKKQQSSSVVYYAPIAKCFAEASMDSSKDQEEVGHIVYDCQGEFGVYQNETDL